MMGVMGRFTDWFLGRRVEQAQSLPRETPAPRLDEYGDTDGPPPSIFALFEPSPDHVNYVFLHSDEWARVVVRIRNEVWRRGLEVVPTHPFFCAACGTPGEDELDACVQCGSVGQMMPPDPKEKHILEDWLNKANSLGESLIELGERKTEEGLKHGRGLVVYRHKYELEDDGRIRTMTLNEVRAGDPGRILKLKDKRGRPGGRFVCLACRGQPGYKPESKPTLCPLCGGVLYEAQWVEYATYANATPIAWWLKDEVHEVRWPYKDGSSPATRIWNKVVMLLWSDRYAAQATDPRTPQRPDKIFVTMGGDEDGVRRWAQRDAEERKRNRYKLSHLHIPSPPGGLAELKMDAKVIDLGDREFKMQSLELRTKFEDSIRAHYHLSDMQAGTQGTATGLGNDSLKLRSTAQVAEDIQTNEIGWLRDLVEKLAIVQFTYRFPPSLEEEDGRDAETVRKELENARAARELGLAVHWRGERAVIPDGEVKRQENGGMFGGFAGFGTQRPTPTQTLQVPDVDTTTQPPLVQQALVNDDQLPKGVSAVLTGPSGAVAAQDALWASYAGIAPDIARTIQGQIVGSLTQPQGWSIDSIVQRILPALEQAGIENPETRARTIARTEVRSIASTWKERLYRVQEAERGVEGRYRIRGAQDFRRTKLSWWIDQAVGTGKPLDDVVRIMDEGIRLAKDGAFTESGRLGGTRGTPIQLPGDFQRRGFLCHFNDRDEVVQVV